MKENSLPSPEELLLLTPLYKKFQLTEENSIRLIELEIYNEPLDAYCAECNQQTVYRRINSPIAHLRYDSSSSPTQAYIRNIEYGGRTATSDRTFDISFSCSRNTQHVIYFYFIVYNNFLSKIGQYPSLADFDAQDIKKYRKVLDRDNLGDLKRAIGLYSHGVGAGAFVYLRRIFENLIEETHSKLANQAEWDEDKYQKCRMNERIQLLKNELPSHLVEMDALYPILSKGVHALSEQECLKYFTLLRIGIEIVLDQKLSQILEKENQKKIEDQKKAIAKIKNEI
ncbi:MAG: hypothetical protein ACOYMG_02640 [Candidatus Methylumidiphilus sp.]